MKSLRTLFLSLSAFCLAASAPCVAADDHINLKIAVVNFKSCVDQSRLGQQEQGTFEALKKQMEGVFMEKEKAMTEIADKFEDPDYLDSLSPEAETEAKRKFRGMAQELTQMEQQYRQTLQQTNFKVIQLLTEEVTEATKAVAEQEKIDIVLNDESAFFYGPKLDISAKIVVAMDKEFAKKAQEAKEASPSELK